METLIFSTIRDSTLTAETGWQKSGASQQFIAPTPLAFEDYAMEIEGDIIPLSDRLTAYSLGLWQLLLILPPG